MQNFKYQRNNVGWYSLDNVLLKTWTQPGRACAGRRDHKMEWGGLKKATGTERDKWNNWAEQFLHLRCTLSHLGSFYKDWPWIPTTVKPGHGGFDQLPRYSHLHPQLSHCLRRKKKKTTTKISETWPLGTQHLMKKEDSETTTIICTSTKWWQWCKNPGKWK